MRGIFATMCALVGAACDGGGVGPPRALEGRWARGDGACRAGLWVTFEARGVFAHAPEGQTLLLAAPRYEPRMVEGGERFVIRYALPTRPGGVSGAGGVGVVELEQVAGGRLRLASARFEDRSTGSVRQRLTDGAPLARTFDLARCEPPTQIQGLRGRS